MQRSEVKSQMTDDQAPAERFAQASRRRATRLGKALAPGHSASAKSGWRMLADVGMSVFKIEHSTIRNSSRGQAMAEYVIIAGLLMAVLGILTVFLVTFKEYGSRIFALVSSEYP